MVALQCRLAVTLLALAANVAAAPDEWTRLDEQAGAQYRAREYAAALTSAQQALVIAERDGISGSAMARLAASLNTLALIHQAQGRLAEAQPLLERALAISLQALPEDHPNITALRANLAALQEARHQQEVAQEARRAQDLNEQALAHHERGEYAEAAMLYEQTLPIVEEHFGAQSIEVARVLSGLADTFEQRKDHVRAEALYRRALAIYETRTDETIARAGVLNALASVYYLQRQYGKAEPLFKQSLGVLQTALGAEHVDLLPVLDNLVALYLTTRRETKGEEFRRRAAVIRKAQGLGASDAPSPVR